MTKLLFTTSILLIFLIIHNNVISQVNVIYDDVALIVNKNDTVSLSIGKYFKAKRNISDVNIISIHVTSKEEITDSEFDSMRRQIENYLVKNNLANKINYLVTTKGCPLKIQRDTADPFNCNASVESELMLILGVYKEKIGNCGSARKFLLGTVTNPYLSAKINFSREKFGIYLVTRLDAYSEEGVFHLIDNSGPNTYVNKDSVQFVFDEAPNWSQEKLLNDFSGITGILKARGWKVYENRDSVYVTHKINVIGYQSWGSNDNHFKYYTDFTAQPYNTWSKASIAETCVSTSARSFQPGTKYGQSLIADLIKEGVTGAKGYVYEPETEAIANPNILYNRYTDLDNEGFPRFNLAESYFAASALLSWKDVVIGDPKTSITTNRPPAIIPKK
jgi:uncharacterized protein (TIGR03790 family)